MQKKLTRSQQKHLDIINAAKEEFIEFGFLAANMDRITSSAEVSKRTLYRHFESKEVLFESVLTIINDSVNESISYHFDPNKSTEEQLTEIAYKEIDVLYKTYGIALARTIVMEFLRQPEMAKTLIQNIYSIRAITQWFRSAIEAKRLKDADPKLMTDVYVSLFQGLFFWPQVMHLDLEPHGEELSQKIETLTTIFLQSYGVAE
ncbi:transcriptional regulator, TetR family [Aliivibrio fischeri ES114]|uniref:Transcriptional regulator, TetR family n=1 Tax=Aliivibrio fischeri (strain ATCC 700601 / ES114) TaxID=312309 RepID=Q5E0L7_ALIF1|nr:TetR/AcrR family transcriptional regulator [Aliivibrio fischeri]QJT41656.1 TetR/AcrR family transcriptional regulator [Cloning vector pMT447]QJT41661.1 TetR/AcrR family transcriptional regulator [Cloning vector pMT448]QJT41665.1 TetR/AcrR family transcriptional regulator [Cloning vector pMT449]QJT41670.1 TetR/AcrR family transcriptional regulator [Cloning vector pMT450]QJT41675.1 TetR/AcrR family transcriptional regulator [Cloning vector pMT451]QJT41680.1 TetR/AcrR family transcriptional r